MTPWITRVAVVSAAGWGVEALMDALCAEPRLRAPSLGMPRASARRSRPWRARRCSRVRCRLRS
jgi:hypothetical protein